MYDLQQGVNSLACFLLDCTVGAYDKTRSKNKRNIGQSLKG